MANSAQAPYGLRLNRHLAVEIAGSKVRHVQHGSATIDFYATTLLAGHLMKQSQVAAARCLTWRRFDNRSVGSHWRAGAT